MLQRAAGPVALAVLFLGLLATSFRKWTDVHVDFGSELYIAWRIAEGEHLYRDLAHRNGPLSHYWNGLLFRTFGVSLTTLVVANLAVLAGIAAMLWRGIARACDRTTATACVAVMLGVFAFGQYSQIGNYNYVTPYHHHQTHGLALGLATLLCFDAATRRASLRWLALAGLCTGAVFLTKAELFVPLAGAAAVAFAARGLGVWRTRAGAGCELAVFAGAALLPVVGLGLWLAAQMPPSQALRGLAGNWVHLAGVGSDTFYRHNAGLDHPVGNARRVLAATGVLVVTGGLLYALDRLAAPLRDRRWLPAAAGLALFAALLAAPVPWWKAAPALPVVGTVAVAALALACLRTADSERRQHLLPQLLFAVYATGLLGKIALASRFDWYGFVLAMPATLLLVAAGVHGLPAWRRERAGAGRVARALALATVAAAGVFFVTVSGRHYAARTFVLGSGGDRMLARGPDRSPRPALRARTLDDLARRARPGETLLVLPEGVSLNYWLRMRNPSRFHLFLPTEIAAFGEPAMLADLAAHPPDYVVLVHRLWKEFGTGPFGQDPRNGKALRAWVDANYRRVSGFGAEPFGPDGFGTVVLERSDR
ncbi:MAG: hypothetical protein ACQGVC_21390 [Myxococcota bacterium]